MLIANMPTCYNRSCFLTTLCYTYMAMAANDELLGQIGKIIDAKLEPVNRQFKTVNKKLNRIQKDISFLIKTYDSHVIHLRGRIERLEEHTGINKN
jgi:hypothetical protein